MNKRLLVTGARGFIGRSLCERIIREGGFVRQATTQSGKGVDFHLDKITADTNWKVALEGIDCIVHLAGRVHVMKETAKNPLAEFRKINVDGTLNLAKQAMDAGVKRFIFVSSIKVNGEVTEPGIPFAAGDTPSPKDPYAISKWEAERGLFDLAKDSEMEIIIIRPPLVYGPGVRANFRALMMLVSKGIPLPFGKINNKRSFIAIDNIVDLIVRCIDHPYAGNKIYLASDGVEISTAELVILIGTFMEKPARLFRVPISFLRIASALTGQKRVAQRLLGSLEIDILKTEQELEWKPPVTMEEAIRKTVVDFMHT